MIRNVNIDLYQYYVSIYHTLVYLFVFIGYPPHIHFGTSKAQHSAWHKVPDT